MRGSHPQQPLMDDERWRSAKQDQDRELRYGARTSRETGWLEAGPLALLPGH